MKVKYIGTGVYDIDFAGHSYRFEANEQKTLADNLYDEVQTKLNSVDGSLWEIIVDNASHTHSNKTTLDSVTEAFTSGLKTTYDGFTAGKENTGVAAGLVTGHTTTYNHANYDAYSTGKENTGVAAGLLGAHTTTYNHANFLSTNGISGSFTTVDSKTITITNGQVTSIV